MAGPEAEPPGANIVSAPVTPEIACDSPAGAARRFNWRAHAWDYAILGFLTAAVILIHARYLQAPILDIDEAEFMASAAYVYFTDQSVFTCPNHTYTIAAFRLAIALSEPYDLLPLRLATIALISAVVGLVYWWVSRATVRWIGCLAAVYVIVVSMFHNAFLVNREWPSALALLSGAYLFLRAQDEATTKQFWMIFAAGLVTGCGLFFKEQAAYITQAAPLWLLIQVICDRRWQPWLMQGLLYAAGGVAAGVIYFAPFVWQGTFRSHLAAEVAFGSMYAYASLDADQESARAIWRGSWLNQFLELRQSPISILLAYLACLSVAPWLINRLRGVASQIEAADSREHQALLLLGCYLATSMFSVAMGDRFFAGYFLLWMPFVAVASGYGFKWIFCGATRWSRIVIWIPLVYSLHRVGNALFQPLTLVLFIGMSCIVWFRGQIDNRKNLQWLPRVALMTLFSLMLFGYAQSMHFYPQKSAHTSSFARPALATRAFFHEHAHLGDRLFIWGAAPEVYCVTGLQPAVRTVACGGGAFTGDYFHPDGLSEEWAKATLAELRTSPPRFIMAAPTAGDAKLKSKRMFALSRFPELAALVQGEYRPVAILPDCDVFELR